MIGRVSPAKSPEALMEKAQQILTNLGYKDPPADSAFSFDFDFAYMGYVLAHDPSPNRWERLDAIRPGPLLFWYRQSPRKLVARSLPGRGRLEVGRITADDPPPVVPGMTDLVLDRWGWLTGFRAVPLQLDTPASTRDPDWSVLLAAAGLDAGALSPAAPRWAAPVDSDRKAAWDGAYAGQPEIPLHVEGAAYRGRPVWFEVQGPWVRPVSLDRGGDRWIVAWTMVAFGSALLVAMGVLVRRNVGLGRGDRKGAARLAGFVFVSLTLGLMFRADHVASVIEESGLVRNILALSLFNAALIWAYYMAVEPIARRRWPELLIAWSRLLAGRLRDPLLGRDGLVGGLAGIVLTLIVHLAVVVPPWVGLAPGPLRARVITTLDASRHLAYFLSYNLCVSVALGLTSLFAMFFFRAILRRRWLALGFQFVFTYVAFLSPAVTNTGTLWSLSSALFTGIWLAVLMRAGLLASVASLFFFLTLEATPLTLDLSAWYAGRTLVCLTVLAAMLIYGFHVSLAGKPLFGRRLLDAEGEG